MAQDPRDSSVAAERERLRREAAERAAEIAKQEAAEREANEKAARAAEAVRVAQAKLAEQIAERNRLAAIERAKRQGKNR